MRRLFIPFLALVLPILAAGQTAHADPPTVPQHPVVDGLSVHVPTVPKWRVVASHRVQDRLFVSYEYDHPAGWAKMTMVVMRHAADGPPVEDAQFKDSILRNMRHNAYLPDGAPTVHDGVFSIPISQKDGSRGVVAARVVPSQKRGPYLVHLIGEWPAGSPASYAKDLDTLLRAVTIK